MSRGFEVVLTTDNALAMRDRDVGEVMHPVVGPLVEAPALYVKPSRLAERLAVPAETPLVLLDVGLGAGSNAIAARRVSELRKHPRRHLRIESFDRTLAALETAASPDYAAAFDLGGEAGEAARALIRNGRHETSASTWTVILGELPEALERTAAGPADIVYWDPFSPTANPGLWTTRAFTALRRCCGPTATVHTYSAATAIRAALLLAGFAVGRGAPTASGRETTIAAVDASDLQQPLGPRWLERLSRSSAPFPPDAPPDAMARVQQQRQFA